MIRGTNLTHGQEHGDQGRSLGASLGGRAVKALTPPEKCPRCGASMAGRSWHSYLGHLGLHATADKHFGGDAVAALHAALARQDPFPENGAWSQWATDEPNEEETTCTLSW